MHTWFTLVKRERERGGNRDRTIDKGEREREKEIVLELVLCFTGLFIQDLLH